MRLPISTVLRSGLLLTFAFSSFACSRDKGPGVTVTCEGGASPKAYVGVKNPHSRLKKEPNSPWIIVEQAKLADFKSAEEACAAILDLAKGLELPAELKDKTTLVIFGADLEVIVPPGLHLKVEKFDKP